VQAQLHVIAVVAVVVRTHLVVAAHQLRSAVAMEAALTLTSRSPRWLDPPRPPAPPPLSPGWPGRRSLHATLDLRPQPSKATKMEINVQQRK
jgi:hypothetical protein